MFASMAGVLKHQFQSNASSASIMESLKGMFGDYGRPARQVAMLKLIGAKMAELTHIKGHALKIIGYLNELETFAAKVDTRLRLISSLTRCLQDRKSTRLNSSH